MRGEKLVGHQPTHVEAGKQVCVCVCEKCDETGEGEGECDDNDMI